MSYGRDNNYAKTDFNFSTAQSVIRGVYCILMVLIVLGALGGVVGIMAEKGGASVGLVTLSTCIISGLLLHVGYSFLIGFFELIKHAREIRNELAVLRAKSGATTPEPVATAQSATSAGTTRYDSATHQYVKA